MTVVVRPSNPPAIVVSPGRRTSPTVIVPADQINISIPTGQPGATGPPGPAGPSGATATLTFPQQVPLNTWVIVHSLGYYPNITIVSSTGDVVEGDVEYTDANTVTVRFTGAFSGTAYLS